MEMEGRGFKKSLQAFSQSVGSGKKNTFISCITNIFGLEINYIKDLSGKN